MGVDRDEAEDNPLKKVIKNENGMITYTAQITAR